MQRGKRWLALLLALVLAAGLLPTAALANGDGTEVTDNETDGSETSGDVETSGGEADNSETARLTGCITSMVRPRTRTKYKKQTAG